MDNISSPISSISDTARWAAFYRAQETERPDAVFNDPFARRLAGDLGEEIARRVTFSTENSWSWIARTYLFDRFILSNLQAGTDMVINLAAGLDARPYRMALPGSLKWIEVDLPEILDHKNKVLAPYEPKCQLERIAVDLSNVAARRELFSQLGRRSNNSVVITEGLVIYFTRDEVASFAEDLAVHSAFQHWILDLSSPGLLKMLSKKMGPQMGPGAVLKFAPAEGPTFFEKYGWRPSETRSIIKTAAKINRLTFVMKLLSTLTPEVPTEKQSSRPWGGVTVLKNSSTTNSVS